MARAVALRVADSERRDAALEAARRQTHYPRSVYWKTFGIAQGNAGIALLCGHMDRCFADEHWDVAAHELLTTAIDAVEREPLGPGLLGGLSGLAFVTSSLSRDGERYGRLLCALDEAIAPPTEALSGLVRAATGGVAVEHFDLISGLSGIGAYLLVADRNEPALERARIELLGALVALTSDAAEPPRWRTPPDLMSSELTAASCPGGSLNCGLAHGIPGPLAVMALALGQGIEIPGLRNAVVSTAQWLVEHRADDEWGMNWPTRFALEPSSPAAATRAAWCYGSPGVARALWLAGRALSDDTLTALAISAMQAVYARPMNRRDIDSPTFCHGVAGLLQITLRFAHDTRLAVFTEAAIDLVEQLLAAYDDDAALGFRSIEPAGNKVDHPGLLEGAAGVALVLLAAACDVEPTWDRMFLLS